MYFSDLFKISPKKNKRFHNSIVKAHSGIRVPFTEHRMEISKVLTVKMKRWCEMLGYHSQECSAAILKVVLIQIELSLKHLSSFWRTYFSRKV